MENKMYIGLFRKLTINKFSLNIVLRPSSEDFRLEDNTDVFCCSPIISNPALSGDDSILSIATNNFFMNEQFRMNSKS